MVVEEIPRSLSDQPEWVQSLRKRLDAVLEWGIWPERWRPWLAERADDLVGLGVRMAAQGAPAAALRSPEEIALDIIEETAPQAVGAPEEAPVAPEEAPSSPAPRTIAPEIFLEEMRDAMQSQSEELEQELRDLRSQRRTVFRALLLAAGITFVFLVIGAALVFAGVIAVGVLSGLVALVPGTGTLILRRLERRVDEDKEEADALRERKVQLLQAIQVTLLIEDPGDRDRAVTDLADELRKRALAAGRAPRKKRAR